MDCLVMGCGGGCTKDRGHQFYIRIWIRGWEEARERQLTFSLNIQRVASGQSLLKHKFCKLLKLKNQELLFSILYVFIL